MEFFNETDCDIEYRTFPDGVNEKWNSGFSIEKANRLLRERGKVVYGHIDPKINSEWTADLSHETEDERLRYWCHRGLLICIEPVEQDSERKVLKDFVAQVDKDFGMSSAWQSLVERAEALLEKGE